MSLVLLVPSCFLVHPMVDHMGCGLSQGPSQGDPSTEDTLKRETLPRGRPLLEVNPPPKKWDQTGSARYRSGMVNSKSFVGKVLLRTKWNFELTVHFKHEMLGK